MPRTLAQWALLWGLECSEDTFEVGASRFPHNSQQVLCEITCPSPAFLFWCHEGTSTHPWGMFMELHQPCLKGPANSHACSVYKMVTRKWRWGQGAKHCQSFYLWHYKEVPGRGPDWSLREYKMQTCAFWWRGARTRRATQPDSTSLPWDAQLLGRASWLSWWFRAGSLMAVW